MDDARIVDLYLARDEEAIRLTKETYGAKLRGLASRILRDPEDAEECENDTYLKAWKQIPPHEPREYLFPFLARITRMSALDRVKEKLREKRNAEIVTLSEELEAVIPARSDVESEAEGHELSRLISDFLRRQEAEKRNIFLRRYWYMDSVQEIAERFGFSESKVKTTLWRTRNELREYLQTEGYVV